MKGQRAQLFQQYLLDNSCKLPTVAVGLLREWTNALLPLGLGGVTLLALQPLTWALSWFSPALSTVIMVAFGLGWLALGIRVARSTDFDRTGMP